MPPKLILIFFFALLLRLYNLSQTPVGFHADEVRVGWNAYSILETGKDDRGNTLALYYNTFGDYRPTGIFYITVPSILLFGLTEFAIRFPGALFGALSVFPVYALATVCFAGNSKGKAIGLFSAIFLAISPWHISTSRATSEVVISLFFALSGLVLLLRGLKNQKKSLFYGAFILLGISYLFYHSMRLLAPLMALGVVFYYWMYKGVLNRLAIILVVLLTLLTAMFMTNKGSLGRFTQVSAINDLKLQQNVTTTQNYTFKNPIFDSRLFLYFTKISQEYLSYFGGEFLIGDTAKPLRYMSPGVGVLTYFEFSIFVIGIIYLIRKKKDQLPLVFLLLAPMAAALTTEDSPNLHRSLMMVPFIAIICGFGVYKLRSSKTILKTVSLVLILALFLNFIYFLQIYFTRAQFVVAQVRNFSAHGLVNYIAEIHTQYDEVIISNDPDDPYPWYGFYNKLDPQEFNQYSIKRSSGEWQYKNLLFTQRECPSGDIFPGPQEKPLEVHILVVDGFKCPIESKIKDGMRAQVIKQFKNPDGSVAYTLWEETKE